MSNIYELPKNQLTNSVALEQIKDWQRRIDIEKLAEYTKKQNLKNAAILKIVLQPYY